MATTTRSLTDSYPASDECSCDRCQHPSPDVSFGFRDPVKAEDITRHMARGNGRCYALVRSHMGVWYFAPINPDDQITRRLFTYLGCEIIKTFDARGDEVK